MSTIADRIRTAQDKDGMLRRALERIIQLYTDKSHFIYELLQNAEDAEANSIKFVQYSDRLEVFHDGRPFTSENLQGLCDIGKSDKVDNLNQIGEFGVGFKSVFGICEIVRLYSVPQNFRDPSAIDAVPFAVEIHDFTRPEDIPEEELDGKYTTRFVFPYAVGKTFSGFDTVGHLQFAVSKKLQNLGITTLLFMKNLDLIEYEIHLPEHTVSGEYLLDKEVINDHCMRVSALGSSSAELPDKKQKGEEILSYLKFTRFLDETSQRSVDIAFPAIIDEKGNYVFQKAKDPYVSVYFPTETESKLDFIVQGPYRTTPNRSSIPAEDKDNIYLAELTAQLYRDSILEMKQSGLLNMSLVKLLPITANRFDNFALFEPLYDVTKSLFSSHAIIPTNAGEYVSAKYAKLARQEKLAQILPDALLSSLIGDGYDYKWLPTYLTETNREYMQVYRFFNIDLHVQVIRPEDLRIYFSNNPYFLPKRDEDWLVDLYGVLENVGAAFSKTQYEANMLIAEIVKTSTGEFVAPYRRTDNRQYIPNVFIPTGKFTASGINFVDAHLYERCRHFFDDILQLQKPNEYEFIIKDIKKRYSEDDFSYDEEKHIEDTKNLLKYLKYEEYREEVQSIIDEDFMLLCTDNFLRYAKYTRVFFPLNTDGVNVEGYFKNIDDSVFFVDIDMYQTHGLSMEDLSVLGVRDSLLINEYITAGTYDLGTRGRQPEWWTTGEFRWRLSMDQIKSVLDYISKHPTAKDSILKSQAVFKTLAANERKLRGKVFISSSTIDNLDNEISDLVKIVRGERTRDWNGKWLYTESLELVSPKEVSKYDISTSIYGPVRNESELYELLSFKKTEADEVDELRKTIPKSQLDAYFESELRQRFGISSFELTETFGENKVYDGDSEDSDDKYPFPIVRVKNWETLRKHAAEMLCFANPVEYQYKVRKIRTSNNEKEARAYLLNMYRYDGVYRYACQLCHEASGSIERAQIFNKPDVELDPMNLCLCPNCAAKYRRIRDSEAVMNRFRRRILDIKESDVSNGEQVIVPLDDEEVWFTQTHFAEIQELLKLENELKSGDSEKAVVLADESEKGGLSVYSGYIGKTITRGRDGFKGIITDVTDTYLVVDVTDGPKAGNTTKIQLQFILGTNGVYEIE